MMDAVPLPTIDLNASPQLHSVRPSITSQSVAISNATGSALFHGPDRVHLASGRRAMEIQGEMIGFRIEHVSKIQRHDGDAFRIGVCKTHDLARCDNRIDLLWFGYLTVGMPHHAMPSRNRPLIITPRHHGTFLSAGFTHPAYRLPQPMLYTPESSSSCSRVCQRRPHIEPLTGTQHHRIHRERS